MYHKKKKHTIKVQKCTNYQRGTCWFEHDKLDNANDKTNEEVMHNQNLIEKNIQPNISWANVKDGRKN